MPLFSPLLSRRNLLVGAGAFTAFAGIGGAIIAQRDGAGLVEYVVRKHLGDIPADDETIRTFARDFMAEEQDLTRYREFSMIAHFREVFMSDLLRPIMPNGPKKKLEKMERRIFTDFLLSTDFFYREDDTAPVHYVALANPHTAGCANPLARFDLDPQFPGQKPAVPA